MVVSVLPGKAAECTVLLAGVHVIQAWASAVHRAVLSCVAWQLNLHCVAWGLRGMNILGDVATEAGPVAG